MSILKTIQCDVCRKEKKEKKFNEGFQGWGGLVGVKGANDETELHLCPEHLKDVLGYTQTIGDENGSAK